MRWVPLLQPRLDGGRYAVRTAVVLACMLGVLAIAFRALPAFADEPIPDPGAIQSTEETSATTFWSGSAEPTPTPAPPSTDESSSPEPSPDSSPADEDVVDTQQAKTTRIEEDHSALGYGGRWHAGTVSAASAGGYRYSGEAGSSVTVRFSGTSVAVVGPLGPTYGRVEVWLDGVKHATVSCYASEYTHQGVLWSVSGLQDAAHLLVLKVAGTKDAASSGTIVVLDAFDVEGVLGDTPSWLPGGSATHEEHDARLFRDGRWIRARSAAASGGSLLYTGTIGSSFTVHFYGSRIAWIGPRFSNYGRAAIYVDGKYRTTVSQYARSVAHRQVIWSTDDLVPGMHTLTIKVLGEADVASRGTVIAVDGFSTDKLLTPRFEEDEARVSRKGSWVDGDSASASGGGYAYARHADSYAFIPFWGTSFRWITMRGPAYGMAEIHLDGRPMGIVDLYAPKFESGSVGWSVGGLKDGYHAVVIRVLGRAAPASLGASVVLDAVEFQGAGVGSSPWSTTKVRLDERDLRLTSSGTWRGDSTAVASSGTYQYSYRPGSRISVTFIGTSVAWIGPTGPSYGHARIYLDGVSLGTVSQYAPSYTHQQAVWEISGLADTAHTLTVHVLGTKDSASSGTVVVVDGFDVVGERVTARGLVASVAREQLGKQYVWAASGPDRFDCSGLVMYCYRVAAGIRLPHYSGWQWRLTDERFASFEPLLPGDLCFSTSPTYIHHVGIYLGFGLSIHAPDTGKFVEYRTAHTWGCYGRIPALSTRG